MRLNGDHIPDETPDEIAARICDGKHERTMLKAMNKALDEANAKQVPIDDKLLAVYQIVVARLLQSQHERVQLGALGHGLSLLRYNLERYKVLHGITTEAPVNVNVGVAIKFGGAEKMGPYAERGGY